MTPKELSLCLRVVRVAPRPSFQEADGPSIGLVLCKERNRVVAEYALRGIATPIGVAEYRLTDDLPARLKESLPSPEQLESELTSAGVEEEGST